ncbi:MAG TPA: GNAT family protein [Ktedonobacterales bacterium]|nr:GNAT family protein [Ktedonobacterales bacterium]
MNSNENAMPSLWRGKLIHLRALEPTDWETYFSWNFDDEQTRPLYFVPPPTSREAVRRWAEQQSTRPISDDNIRCAIARLDDDAVVGNIDTHDADPRVGTFSYGINVKRGEQRKGYAREAVLLLLRYYFQERRYQKATVTIYSFNEASKRLHESLSFQLEGRVRRMVYTDGSYHDHLIYGLTVEEFREKHLASM